MSDLQFFFFTAEISTKIKNKKIGFSQNHAVACHYTKVFQFFQYFFLDLFLLLRKCQKVTSDR